jgi:hypothetical protein
MVALRKDDLAKEIIAYHMELAERGVVLTN